MDGQNHFCRIAYNKWLDILETGFCRFTKNPFQMNTRFKLLHKRFLTLSGDWLYYNHGYKLVFSPAIETETRKRGADIDQKRKNKEINYCYPAGDMLFAVRVWGKKHFRWFQDIR